MSKLFAMVFGKTKGKSSQSVRSVTSEKRDDASCRTNYVLCDDCANFLDPRPAQNVRTDLENCCLESNSWTLPGLVCNWTDVNTL